MLELITAAYTFWSYCEDLGTLRKIIFVIKRYSHFVKWYFTNPEIRIKYAKVITTKTSEETISRIHESLVRKGINFGDDFTKTDKSLSFEVERSRLSYKILIDKISRTKDLLTVETKYTSFYPLRRFKMLNDITSEFSNVVEIISNPLHIVGINHIIFIEIVKIENKNEELRNFEKLKAEVTFNGNKIQINNLQGTEQGDFIVYLLMKWLQEYKQS